MKTRRVIMIKNEILTVRHRGSHGHRRQSSTIIVVLALLMGLLTLGFLFLTLASQAGINAEYYVESRKVKEPSINIDLHLIGLKQSFRGPGLANKQSVFYGGYTSFLANMYGSDLQPFTGQGINLIAGGFPDQNYDGVADARNGHLGTLNHSPSATGGVDRADVTLSDAFINFPQPDVPYTYGDHTSPFLSYDYILPSGQRVIVPSYFRPQLMPRETPATSYLTWHSAPATAALSMRPHHLHLALLQNGTPAELAPGQPIYRYITTKDDATTLGLAAPFPFPANEVDSNGDGIVDPAEDINGNGVFDRIAYGVWSGQGSVYQFDVDNDGDGVKESIWLDLGFPIINHPSGKKIIPMVSIMVKEMDSLLNVNVHGNYASVAALRVNNNNTGAIVPLFGNGKFLSRSNQGVRPSEVNPQYALFAPVPFTGDPSLEQHRLYFDNTREPANTLELANLEWFWLLTGRPELEFDALTGTTTVNSMIPGRWGEQGALGNGNASAQDAWDPLIAAPFPAPGVTLRFDRTNLLAADDNRDLFRGGIHNDPTGTVFPSGINFPAWRQPVDLFAAGSFVALGDPTRRRLIQVGDSALPPRHQFAQYDSTYWNDWKFLNPPTPQYPYLTNPFVDTHHDEPSETHIEPALANVQKSDAIYPSSTTASLQFSNAVLTALGLNNDRILKLMPQMFGTSGPNAAGSGLRRSRFTADSSDPKSYSKPFYPFFSPTDPMRSWEFNTAASGVREFPPTYYDLTQAPPVPLNVALDPFRLELRELLRVAPKGPLDSFVVNPILGLKRPQRKLSVNRILDRDLTDGRLRFRPLTPHPVNLPRQPVLLDHTDSTKFSISSNLLTIFRNRTIDPINNPAPNPKNIHAVDLVDFKHLYDQEFMARYDRQRLCRDIYVMLYTFGGGPDVDYTASNTGNALYSNLQLQEMAQFAANLVDYIDEDDVATVFEYDTNLANGWNLDDNPFSNIHIAHDPLNPIVPKLEPVSERFVVIGKEAQKLVLNEAIAILAKKVLDPMTSNGVPHEATEYDDTNHRDFLSFEIQNVIPDDVTFANDSWQVRITQVTNSIPILEERRLLLRSGAGGVLKVGGPKSQLTIFTAGDHHNPVPSSIPPSPYSIFRVNPLYKDEIAPNHNKLGDMTQIMPNPNFVGANDIDLIARTTLPDNTFIVYEKPASGSGDGLKIAVDPTPDIGGNAGRDLLSWIIPDPTVVPPDPLADPRDSLLPGNSIRVKLELRRRVNLRREPPVLNSDTAIGPGHAAQSQDNPWVSVDETIIELGVFDLEHQGNTPKYDLRKKLIDRTRSLQRTQPLYGNTNSGITSNDRYFVDSANLDPRVYDPLMNPLLIPPPQSLIPANYSFNSLGGSTQYPPVVAPFTIWEPHPDRPLASIAEMFDIPLYGPGVTTQQIGNKSVGPPVIFKLNRMATAGRKFVDPTITVEGSRFLVPNDNTSPRPGNRWYRILEFLEVPDVDPHGGVAPAEFPTLQSLMNKPWFVNDAGREGTTGDALGFYRTPGKLNINMLHHPAILAGLLDEPNALGDGITSPLLVDTDGRNWWSQYLRARDGLDTISGLNLPGVPGESRPFRDFSFSLNGVNGLDDTLLRRLPADAAFQADPNGGPPIPGRRLFEMGTGAQNVNWSQNLGIDHTTRYRLLNKVINNTTKRSNVFAVWITVGFFEVAEIEASNGELIPRIGGELGGEVDGIRSQKFYIIDRSRAHSSLLPGDLPAPTPPVPPAVANNFIWSFNKDYNIDRSILHRQTIK